MLCDVTAEALSLQASRAKCSMQHLTIAHRARARLLTRKASSCHLAEQVLVRLILRLSGPHTTGHHALVAQL